MTSETSSGHGRLIGLRPFFADSFFVDSPRHRDALVIETLSSSRRSRPRDNRRDALVLATLSLGGYVGTEATLSYLGLGLQPPVVSWGTAISDAQPYLASAPHMLLFPSLVLTVTVLALVLLGEAVRRAFDPRSR